MIQNPDTLMPQIIDDEKTVDSLPAIVRLWIFRFLVDVKVDQIFLRHGCFYDDDVACQIGLGAWLGDVKIDANKVRLQIREIYRQLQQTRVEVPATLKINVQRMAHLVGLNEIEMRIFEFAMLMYNYKELFEICECQTNLQTRELVNRLARVLELPVNLVRDALQPHAALGRSGLLMIDRGRPCSLAGKFELTSSTLPDRLNEKVGEPLDWIKDRVHISEPGHLQWSDYTHLSKPLTLLRLYLQQALKAGRKGVNIFLYGPPGTGKTQLAKLLANDMGCELYEVITEKENGAPIAGYKRVGAYCTANSFFAKRRALILFDEVEDVFEDNEGRFSSKEFSHKGSNGGHRRKGWINRVLENNAIPTLWVSNTLNGLDPAFARRFDLVVELPVPPRSHRERIIRESCADLLPESFVSRMAASEHLAPALISRASQVVSVIADQMQPQQAAEAVELLVNSTLQAQGHKTIARHGAYQLPEVYDPAFINAGLNLNEIATQLMQVRTGRVCLYGPPGTGKTAFGRWLAQQMDAPLIVKRASDLLGMYVGESEKRIARAFADAEAQEAVLLIDEVDSFLQDRQGAQRSWEVSQVNEMLTQMESFNGVFIASTNLMDQLDPAVLRRFDLKVKMNYLRGPQAVQMLQRYCEHVNLPKPTEADLREVEMFEKLTPGDFAAVLRQSHLRSLVTAADWIKALSDECEFKPGPRKTMGFMY